MKDSQPFDHRRFSCLPCHQVPFLGRTTSTVRIPSASWSASVHTST